MVSILNKDKLIIDLITDSVIFFRVDIPHRRNKYNRYKGNMKDNQITNKLRINSQIYERELMINKRLNNMSLINS